MLSPALREGCWIGQGLSEKPVGHHHAHQSQSHTYGVDEIWKTNFPYAQMVPVAAKGKELTPAPDAGRECCEALLSKNVAPLPPRRGANVCQAQEKGDELVVKISEAHMAGGLRDGVGSPRKA